MSSSVKPNRTRLAIFEKWNRKLHFYLGLYFLFFLWLFSFTGLLLNHGRWIAAANERKESRYERPVEAPVGSTDRDRIQDLMRQLDLRGEIDVPANQQPGELAFNVNRPSDASQVRVDLENKQAAIQHFDNSGWATFRIFHTFSGSRYNQPASHREWIATTLWVFAMDALAGGLIVMVLGSYYMWYRLKRSHALGWMALLAGAASCALFVRGLLFG